MSFIDCINNNTLLTKGQKQSLVNEYDATVKKYSGTMSSLDAANMAAQDFVKIKANFLASKKMNNIKDVLSWQIKDAELKRAAQEHKNLRTSNWVSKRLYANSDITSAVMDDLEKTYMATQTIERASKKYIFEQIEKHSSKYAGLKQDKVSMRLAVREMLGDTTGDAGAKADGEAYRNTMDYLHERYKKAGGIVGYVNNYFPQRHTPKLVKDMGFPAWSSLIKSKIDINKMINDDTGLPFTVDELDAILPKVFDNIVTNGLNDLADRAAKGLQTFGKGGGVAQRHNASRFFVFKDAESFLQYNEVAGVGDTGLFDAVMFHIHTMSRDIGLLEQMGPKPDSTIERMLMRVKEDGSSSKAPNTVRGMYDVLAGKLSYNGENHILYEATMNIQHLLRASLLAGSAISATADTAFVASTARLNGLPATKAMKNYLGLLNPLDPSDRRIMARNGFTASSVNGKSLATARYMQDAGGGNQMLATASSFVHRAGGLSAMTDAASHAVPQAAMGFFAEAKHTKIKFNDLPDMMLEAFERNGITEVDYENILKAELYIDPDTGADFMVPENIAKINVDSAAKFDFWLQKMSNKSSNEPTLLTRSLATGAAFGNAQTGTVLRASVSSLMMFKSFGITVINNHFIPALRRMADSNSNNRAKEPLFLLASTTVMGAFAMQLSAMRDGKTMQDMDNSSFWTAAAMRGGGFGIFGDFLFSDTSRFGSDLMTTMMGPMFGFGQDVSKVFKGNFDKALSDDKESKFAADLAQFTERYVPVVKLWYTKLLVERLFFDHLESLVDPNYDKRMKRIEKKIEDEKGQEFWWAPSG